LVSQLWATSLVNELNTKVLKGNKEFSIRCGDLLEPCIIIFLLEWKPSTTQMSSWIKFGSKFNSWTHLSVGYKYWHLLYYVDRKEPSILHLTRPLTYFFHLCSNGTISHHVNSTPAIQHNISTGNIKFCASIALFQIQLFLYFHIFPITQAMHYASSTLSYYKSSKIRSEASILLCCIAVMTVVASIILLLIYYMIR
jgi:hypothetical protein